MAWEWSHSPEAYQAAYENVCDLPKDTLLEILGEWRYYRREKLGIRPLHFDLPSHYYDLTEDVLADEVWRRMEEYATCDNGGWNAYCCPDGCHTVPFDRKDDNE